MIRWRQPSLNGRLLASVLLVSIVYWGAIALLTIRDNVDEIDELFDRQLAQTALALLRVADPDELETTPSAPARAPADTLSRWGELPQRLAALRTRRDAPASAADSPNAATRGETTSIQQQYERHRRYQVWTRDGQLLLRSNNSPDAVMARSDGFSESADADGHQWRHYAVRDQHDDFRVIVSEDRALRDGLVRSTTLRMASPLALGLPALVGLLWLAIRRALRPLGPLAREISAREPAKLAPLDAASAPREVQPMVQALNTLLARVDDTLEGERRFTANAAHELRTPLAAIRAQLHLARSAATDDERRQAHDQLQQGVERGIRLVGQLLALARVDPEQTLQGAQAVDLAALAQAVCAEQAPTALQREQELGLDVQPGVPPARGNADLLAVLLSNLVDNAIRYGERGGRIDVTVGADVDGVRVDVSDDGPGIPPHLRERVFDRFFRGTHSQPGNGLGLALCQRIAELHGSRVVLSDPDAERGLRASFTLPAWHEPAGGAPPTP